MLKLCPLKATILDGGQGHWTQFSYWFQRRRFLSIFSIGSYVKTMSADGSHLGWGSESPPSKMVAFSGHSFNIGPYGKKCFKIFSFETSKPI
jgi:hypothetical protein